MIKSLLQNLLGTVKLALRQTGMSILLCDGDEVAGTLRVPSANGTRSVPATFTGESRTDISVCRFVSPQSRLKAVLRTGHLFTLEMQGFEVPALVGMPLLVAFSKGFKVFHRMHSPHSPEKKRFCP